MELDRRLSKAKTALILDHPFFGNLAMNMPQIITDAVPTAATNGKHILYNPDFCKGLNNDNLVFLIAHEVMHPALDHITRVGERDPERWNYAGDTVINPMLVDEGIGAFIDGGVMDRDLLNKVVALLMVSTTCCHHNPMEEVAMVTRVKVNPLMNFNLMRVHLLR